MSGEVKPLENSVKKGILDRLEKRKEKFLAEYERNVRLVEKDGVSEETELNRQWVEKFLIDLGLYKSGRGLDVYCGDFLIGEAIGVDGDLSKIGPVFYTEGDALTNVDNEEMDYITTNYFEAFPNVLKVLHEWYRALRRGGWLIFTVLDAEQYDNKFGALANPRRLNVFTEKTIKNYLFRAGFDRVMVTKGAGKCLRISARKP